MYGWVSSDTDTASETDEEVPLPIVLTAVYRPQHENLAMRELRNLGQEVYEHVIVADDASSYTKVEQLTREQSHTQTWDLFRAGRITASKVHDILTRRNTTDPKNLTSRVLGYGGHFTTPATQWGLDTEAEALAVYETTMLPYHPEVSVKRTGLLLSQVYPYLGASPDGVRNCGCHGDILVEVKCPFALKGQDPMVKFGDSNFCIDISGNLKTTHRYYSQIQLQLELAQMSTCDLVIYTGVPDKLYVTSVAKDEDFCERMITKSTQFFFNHVLPELLSRSIERSIDRPSPEGMGICFCGKLPKGRMVECSEAACCIKQFHYPCVGLTRKPRKYQWFCPVCLRMAEVTDVGVH